MALNSRLEAKVRAAVHQFWTTRQLQAKKQGADTGLSDTGARRAVTGGAQMGGFVALIREMLMTAGLREESIFFQTSLQLPGWYRPEKTWDLLVVVEGQLIAAMELKSHIGPSFGNNYNNRTEEALGSATDVWAAYREGAFSPSSRPWLGYLMLLEEHSKSTAPVRAAEPHFKVFEEFRGASYARRYELLLTKMVRERLYDSACLLLADQSKSGSGAYREPSPELSFQNFVTPLLAKAVAVAASISRSL